MINFSLILHLTHKNLSSFPNTLDSILNQKKRFMDMTIISEIPNVEFDIRTLNTKVVFASENIDYKSVFGKCLAPYIIFIDNKTSEVIFNENFCMKLKNDADFLMNSEIVVYEKSPALYMVEKNFVIENDEISVENKLNELPIVGLSGIQLKSLS